MQQNHIPLEQQTISNCIGIYYRAMETDAFVFFVNFHEGDENAQVIMLRKTQCRLELVSDNYFAAVGMEDEFRAGNETWMSLEMKKARQLQIEEFMPLVKEYIQLSDKSDIGKRFIELQEELDEFHVALPENNVCDFLKEKFCVCDF
jgi:hypothetical protein